MIHPRPVYWIAAAVLCSPAASAQISAPPISSALPAVSKISLANAAGVLKYCQQKDLVSSAAAEAITGAFDHKPDVKSADYLAGANGEILGDGGRAFAIPKAPGYLQSSACNIVLEQAKTFRRP